jgi:hypothetical protein
MMRKITMIGTFALVMGLALSSTANAANAPYLPPIADQTAMIGEPWTFDVDALYADPAESYELIDTRPGMTINAATGLISWTPVNEEDGGKVTVRAWNSAGESVRSFLVYLSDAIVCSDNIISYWKFDETSGSTFEDFKGGYNAVALTSNFKDTTGKVDRALSLEPLGVTDQALYVEDMQQYDFGRNEGFSISFWFKYKGQHTAATVNQAIVTRGNPSTTYANMFYLIAIDAQQSPAKLYFQIRPNSTEDVKAVTSDYSILPGMWYHAVAVYEGLAGQKCKQHLYVNGNPPNTRETYWSDIASFDGGTGKPLEIGNFSYYGTNTYPFNGIVDEMVAYNKALSQSEVNALYSDGLNGKPCCKPGNYFPLITSTPITSAVQDVLYSYIFEAKDYEGGLITLSAEIKPSWLTFYPISGELTGTPSNLDVGDHQVKLKATDGTTTIYQEFTISVQNENDAPEITSTPSVTTLVQGTAFSYTLVAIDTDPGDVVTLSAPTLPDWLSFNAESGLLSGTPGPEAAGYQPDTTHHVVLRATDLVGAYDEQEINIKVTNVNDPPELLSQQELQISRGGSGEITKSLLTVYDPDDHYPADHTVTVVAGDDYTFVGNVVTPDPAFYGNLDVNLEISDGQATAQEVFVMRVNYVDIEPVFTSTPDTTAHEGQAYTYVVDAFDPDEDDDINPQTLTYTAQVLPTWLTFTQGSNILVGIPQRANVGDNPVSIKVTDGTYDVYQTFTITVISNNNKPVITSNPPLLVDNYSEYIYMISAYDADVSDVLTFGVELLPAWLTFNPEDRTLKGTPTKSDVGENNVILNVSDGYDIVKQEFTITVRDVNVPPVVISEPEDTAYVNRQYTYLVNAVDYDGDAVTYGQVVIPSWATFNPATRVLSGTPTSADVGISHQVYINIIAGVHNVPHQFYITVVYPTGINDGVEFASSVYPNPADNHVIFELARDARRIEITDLTGRVVTMVSVKHGERSVQIDISHLSSGLYLFKVSDGNAIQTGQIVVQ